MKLYSDLSTFPGSEEHVNEQAIRGCIHNILHTTKGSYAFNRTVGTPLERYLFEPLENIRPVEVLIVVKSAISQQLPSVIVLNTSKVEVNHDNRSLNIFLDIEIPQLGRIIRHDDTYDLIRKH